MNDTAKIKKKSSTKQTILHLFLIFVVLLFTYVAMVFISHFSVYQNSGTYKISDSFKAMMLKTDVPAQFFIYFGIFVIATVSIALFFNFVSKIFNHKK